MKRKVIIVLSIIIAVALLVMCFSLPEISNYLNIELDESKITEIREIVISLVIIGGIVEYYLLNKKKTKNKNNKHVHNLVVIALLSSIAVVLSFIEIPYIVSYLKIEISDVIPLIALSFGFPVALAIAAIKAFIKYITGSYTQGLGELTMFIGSFTLIASYYLSKIRFSKKISLVIMSIAFSIVMVVLNYYIITPMYYPYSYQELSTMSQEINGITINYLEYVIILYLPFNLIKAAIISVCYYFTSEKLDKLLGKNGN